jgi:hypothetical protein
VRKFWHNGILIILEIDIKFFSVKDIVVSEKIRDSD